MISVLLTFDDGVKITAVFDAAKVRLVWLSRYMAEEGIISAVILSHTR